MIIRPSGPAASLLFKAVGWSKTTIVGYLELFQISRGKCENLVTVEDRVEDRVVFRL